MTPRRNGARRSWRWRPSSGATSPPICRHSSTRPWIVSNPHSPRTTDMSDTQSRAVPHAFWPVVLLAASVLMIIMGARQLVGLFVSSLNRATGLGIVSISLAMAVGKFMWGAVQPIAGAVADRYGPGRVLAAGTIILALGYATTPYMTSSFGLMMTIGVLTAAGSGAGSFSVLIGAAAQRLPGEKRGMAAGIINAGGSFGQFLFAPLLQKLISMLGWMGAMWSMAVISLFTLPMSWMLRKRPAAASHSQSGHAASVSDGKAVDGGIKKAIRIALADRSYLLLHAGFFTCGFHIAFLVTHLPGEVQLCGLHLAGQEIGRAHD